MAPGVAWLIVVLGVPVVVCCDVFLVLAWDISEDEACEVVVVISGVLIEIAGKELVFPDCDVLIAVALPWVSSAVECWVVGSAAARRDDERDGKGPTDSKRRFTFS